jgi:hypothetical protein
VGPRAVLDAVVKRKIPSPRRESNPRTTIVQPVGVGENCIKRGFTVYIVRKIKSWRMRWTGHVASMG